ncbi:MAG: nitrogenase, partial [Lachnospiraceae bacterium]|nr:nitrogenase [Lachnospiraceae bacterium]
MLKRVGGEINPRGAAVAIRDAHFPSPFVSGLEYATPARGTWNIVHTGMLIPEAHEIFVCAAGCLRGVVLTAAELHAEHRFSTVAVREHNLLDGDMEELVIEGVSDIIEKLPKRPPAVLVYTSCIHHFAGCDLDMIYRELRSRFPDIDFTDCYMNPIMRKSGLTPDQLMRSRLYMLLKEREKKENTVAIIGNDLPTDENSELYRYLKEQNFKIHEITSCKTYEEYQEMAESELYISYNAAAFAGGKMLEERLGGRHFYLPFSFNYDEIDRGYQTLAEALGRPAPDFSGKREECDKALRETRELIGDTEIAIDFAFCPRPLGLARMLLDAGFNVKKVYLDAISGEEKNDYLYLQHAFPNLMLHPTVHAKMRFMASKEPTKILAIGQKAAYFSNTNHFVNVVEGGGMHG